MRKIEGKIRRRVYLFEIMNELVVEEKWTTS